MSKKYLELPHKSLYKTITWRIFSVISTVLIIYVMTGDIASSLAIGGVDALVKTFAYYFHERIWNGIHVGKKKVK